MVLHSITVSHVRCFRNPVTVGPFGDGINILYGPNESGKSTLLESAALALLDRHRTGGEDVNSFVPWGTTLNPEITLEFSADGDDYRLTKTFVSGQRAMLAERVNGAYRDLHEGDAADTAVRELLLGEAPGRGRARPEQWGILRLLWSFQSPNGQDGRLVTEPVADRLREALGGVEVRSYLGEIARRVEEQYSGIFTPQRGDYRVGSVIEQLRGHLEELTGKQDQARQALEEVQHWADRLEVLERELARLAAELAEAQTKVEEHRKSAAELLQVRERVKLARAELAAQETRLQEAQQRLKGYQEQTRLYEEHREQCRRLSVGQQQAQDSVRVLEERGAELRTAVEQAEGAAADLRERVTQARRAEKRQTLEDEKARLAAQLKEIEALAVRVREAEQLVAQMPLPSRRDLKNATETEAECHRLRAEAEALGLRVRVLAEKKQTVRFQALGSEQAQEQSLKAHEEAEFTSSGRASLALPGIAQVEVLSGSTEAASAREQLAEAERRLAESLARFGVRTAAELAAYAERAKARRDEVTELRKRLSERAAPYEDEAEVRQHLTQCEKQIEALTSDEGTASAGTVEELEGKLQAAEREAKAQRRHLERNAEEQESARSSLAAIDQALAVAVSRRDTARERADELLGMAKDEGDLTQAVADEKAEWEKAQQRAQDLEDKLPPPESDPEALLQTAVQAVEEIVQQDRRLRDEQVLLQDRVQTAESVGRYEVLSAVEEEVVQTQRRLERELTRAVGLKLLRSVLRARRQETRSGALLGLETRISRILSAVTGRMDRHVRVDADFSVPGVATDPQSSPVRDLRLLSAGTQEQLWLCVRISLGETYAERYGRQAMILDDVLVYTDPDRHDRVLQVLRRAAEKLQIFIVTSRPALYRGLTEPEWQFDVGAL